MSTPTDLRTPPHSIESEQSVLGGLLLDNDAIYRAQTGARSIIKRTLIAFYLRGVLSATVTTWLFRVLRLRSA